MINCFVRITELTIDCGNACNAASVRRTMTVSALVNGFRFYSLLIASQQNQQSSRSPCVLNRGKHQCVSMSLSRSISPDTACEILITVPKSRCSIGVPIVMLGLIARCSSVRPGYKSSSCLTLPIAPQRM
jgi:hypothetical protein